MSTKTSVHSNAFNFMSFLLSQVDPRTGLYTCAISLPELKANNLSGPVVPLQLAFNPLNARDSGFGKGWNVQLSQFDPVTGLLSLYTGESFKVVVGGPQPLIPEKKLDSFHFHEQVDNGRKSWRIEHKSGLVEILQVGQGDLAMPIEMRSPQGHVVTLGYTPFGTDPLLSSITNADGTLLLSLLRTTHSLVLKLHPDTEFEARFVMNIIGGETKSLVLPTEDQASWRFEYILKSNLTCLHQVWTPTGGHELITYSGTPHSFPGVSGRSVPRVESHVRAPGSLQPAIETHYAYDASGANFLGYGSGVSWTDDGLDNLNKDGVTRDYTYESSETLWDAVSKTAVRCTRRVFNRAHLMLLEASTQFSTQPGRSATLLETESTYHFDPDLNFQDQKAYFQLPKTVTQTWRHENATLPRHQQTTTTHFDNFGNLLTQVDPNGVTQTNQWYTAEGETGCPPDPQGFVRNLKSNTVTPAVSDVGDAPTLRSDYRYTAELGLTGFGPWLATLDETLTHIVAGQSNTVQVSAYKYINTPASAFEHGRLLQNDVTLNGNTTKTRYSYALSRYDRTAQAVLRTDSEVVGFDDMATNPVRKRVTLLHSLLNGEPLLNRDDNDVEIAYTYDVLSRVTRETVAPGTDYEASRTYTYALTHAVGQQAMQTACDVKGVTTTTWLDGFNRAIRETRQNADAVEPAARALPRDIYAALYDNREQLVSETSIDWENDKDVSLISRFKYDDWGEQRSTLRPDGVEEHQVTDPVLRTRTDWLEVAGKNATGKTQTTLNLFDKPDCIRRYALGIDPTAPQAGWYSEHSYRYDGSGRTAEELDAAGNKTTYTYDAFDRMVKTLLPDFNEVEREYAPHSSDDLPIAISVNGVVLGTQAFDGLDRMVASTTGGRRSEYTFDPGQRQPKSVLRPSGVETGYVYRPELGEDPEQRIAVESTAVYDYDPQSARLSSTQEQDEQGITHSLSREYFSTGELKSERREQTGEASRVMYYEYSRQARLLSYTDVLGQTQTYTYNTRAQLTATQLGSTRSTFTYDDLAQVKSIDTVDGEQRLKISLEYDDFGREILRTFDFGNSITQTLSQTYDEADRLTQRILEQADELLRDETYTYDERARLVDYSCTGSQCPVDPYDKTISNQLFGFDALNNLTFVETTFESGRHAIEFEYRNELDPCQLTAIENVLSPPRFGDLTYPGRTEFLYDAEGNLLTDEQGRLLAYDSLSRLISVTAAPGDTPTGYRYDSLDTLSSSGNEQRFYQGTELANLVQGADSSTFLRANGKVLAERQEGADPKS